MPHAREGAYRIEAELPAYQQAAAQRAHVAKLIATDAPIALFLDIDGTLLDVALTPDLVRVPAGLPNLLEALSMRLSGALAIITGRKLAEADHLLQPTKLIAAGVHGAQMRMTRLGKIESLAPDFAPALRSDIKQVAVQLPGVVFEDKGDGIALHYRLAPEQQMPLMQELERLLSKYPDQFRIVGGRKVVEVLPLGFSKGVALRRLTALPHFAKKIPVMIGDDIADIGAFQAAEELGGFGLKVAGEHFAADEAAFQGPADVLGWLQSIAL